MIDTVKQGGMGPDVHRDTRWPCFMRTGNEYVAHATPGTTGNEYIAHATQAESFCAPA